jgi:hypothetical protein
MNPVSSFWKIWTNTTAEKAKQPQDEQDYDNGPHNVFLLIFLMGISCRPQATIKNHQDLDLLTSLKRFLPSFFLHPLG